MFGHYSKVYSDMMDEKISRVLGKLPASSSVTTFVPPNTHVSTSSAASSTSTSQPLYGMPLNSFDVQTPHKLSSAKPLNMIPPVQNTSGSAWSGRTNQLALFTTPPPPQPTAARNMFTAPSGHMVDAQPHFAAAPQPRADHQESELMIRFKADIERQFRDLGFSLPNSTRLYQKPYPTHFDDVPYPQYWRVPDFVKFDGDSSRTTWEHISQYIAQLGEAGSNDALRVCLFSLSLTGTAFSWFSSLPAGSIICWEQLEHKFHEHFFSGSNEAGLADLRSVKQSREKSVADYFRRFRDVKNRCFNLIISEKDLAGLALTVYDLI